MVVYVEKEGLGQGITKTLILCPTSKCGGRQGGKWGIGG